MSSNLLQLTGGCKAFGMQTVFNDAFVTINEGEHVGVIGPNGAGKTTLFKILIGEEDLDAGILIRSRQLSLGYLSQHDLWKPEETGNDYLSRVCQLPLWQVKAMGRELQITEEIFAKPIVSLSGGYRMRIKLTGLLGLDPNLMLLDEPTNYLDLETTLLLERFLQNYRGAFLLISHDREFLRRTTDHTVEVEAGEITKYNGNIDDYFEQKELLRAQLEAQARSQAEKRKTVMDFVQRFGAKATKAKQAQSRLKALEKMEVIELKPVPVRASIQIPEPTHVGKSVLRLAGAVFGYTSKVVLKNVNLDIKRGEHVAVVGLNGAGKSTLLKGIAGTLTPLSGQRELGYQVEMAIFNQHVVEVLSPEKTVLESLQESASHDVTAQDIRNMAGSLLFSDDHIKKPVRVLSGGEKSRVALGQILLKKVPCLLLDEPTNHLDFQTVEALTQALRKYSGTLIVVSHDRGFIRRVATQILEVAEGDVHLYPGTYDEYVWSLQKSLAEGLEAQPLAPQTGVEKPSKPAKYQESKERSKRQRTIAKRIETLEDQISKLEAQNLRLNEEISNAPQPSAIQQLSENTIALQKLENEWTELGLELDQLKT